MFELKTKSVLNCIKQYHRLLYTKLFIFNCTHNTVLRKKMSTALNFTP